MSSVSGFRGVYAVGWGQTAPGDEWGLAPEFLSVGMNWRWRGEARRLDAGVETLWLDHPFERADPRARARSRMQRLALAELRDIDAAPTTLEDSLPENSLVLTDGHKLFPARLIRQGGQMLLVFAPLLPMPERELWIAALNIAPSGARETSVICFLPGTQIATPSGTRNVESLAPGDLVSTRDTGARPVVWRGETRLSGAELYLYPHLRPYRIASGALGQDRPEGDLLISPEHRVLQHAPAFCGAGEVLVSARDLEDGRKVRRDFSLSSVTYVHLMLEQHEIITANGVPCESFHPGLADPRVLAWHARSLERAHPGLIADPARFGDTARRCLDRGEAGILRGVLA